MRQFKKAHRETECWIWPYAMSNAGYGSFNGRTAHEIIYKFIKGKISINCELDHKCRNRLCCNPEHMQIVSHAVNCQIGNGAKLSIENVIKIREMAGKNTQEEIGKLFGVSGCCIWKVINGQSWKNI